ncbi:MAG: hypothetical protein ACLVGR_04710 [Anaerovoracaceae bacterium]
MSKIAAWAHERDSQAAFVSETGVPAHERDPQAAFVRKTGALAHERDSQVAFVRKTGALAHERDPQAAFRLLIVRMVLKIAAAAKLLAAAAYGMVTGLGAKMHAPCPVSKEHYFLK